MKTYLQLVNAVLVELRENEVTTISSTYSKMIGAFVNKAKAQVEDAHDWSALLTDLRITTIPAQYEYSLAGTQNRATIDAVYNVDTPSTLRESTRRWINDKYKLGNVPDTAATHWANNGVDGSGDCNIILYPTPTATESIDVTLWLRTDDLESDIDTLAVPHRPVVDLAVAFASRERGEVGGASTAEHFELAKRSLSDAIAYDAARNEDESLWYYV